MSKRGGYKSYSRRLQRANYLYNLVEQLTGHLPDNRQLFYLKSINKITDKLNMEEMDHLESLLKAIRDNPNKI